MLRDKLKKKKKRQWSKTVRCSESNSKKRVCSNTILPQERRKISNKQPKLTPKATRERTKSKLSKRNHKDQNRNEWNRHKENKSKVQWN